MKDGDLVVHQDHGIGRYGGLCKMEIEKKVNDFVIIEYSNNDRLYIPADRISILQKYVARMIKTQTGSIGRKLVDLAKKKAKGSIREIASNFLKSMHYEITEGLFLLTSRTIFTGSSRQPLNTRRHLTRSSH